MAVLFGAALLWSARTPEAFAQSEDSPKATATPGALTEADYFKTIKVVQKRPVGKARRFEISPFLEYLPNDDFVRGYMPGVNLDYHFTEGVALEGTVVYGAHSNKQLLGDLRKDGVQPAVLDRASLIASGGFNWAPIYGKISYLERRIITYDLFLTTGYGVTSTQLEVTSNTTGGGGGGAGTEITEKRSASFQGYYIGIGQRYYFSHWAALRVEVRNYAYTQRVDGAYNNRNNLLVGAGFSFFL